MKQHLIVFRCNQLFSKWTIRNNKHFSSSKDNLNLELPFLKTHRILKNETNLSKIKVAVGISGGVDSSVSAYLLKKAGFDVTGVYMHNWEDERGKCTGKEDFESATAVCNHLDIPLKRVEFVKQYWNEVFTQFLDGLEKGRTPNPDVHCNKEIKFKHMYNHVMSQLNVDYLATGHYAQNGWQMTADDQWKPTLLKSKDEMKDQTYFLCNINGDALKNTLFPVGHLLKSQVREIAEYANLSSANRKDSYGLCFVGQQPWPDFVGQFIPSKVGNLFIAPLSRAEKHKIAPVTHNGAHLFTIGQQARIGGMPEKYFVYKTDIRKNEVYLCPANHPALYCDEVILKDTVWIAQSEPTQILSGGSVECEYRCRHRQPLARCSVSKMKSGEIRVRFSIPQRAATVGQIVAFYQNDVCLGGGEISKTGLNYWDQGKPSPSQFSV